MFAPSHFLKASGLKHPFAFFLFYVSLADSPDPNCAKYLLPYNYNCHFSHRPNPKYSPQNAQNFSIASQIYTVCFTVLHKTFHQMHDFPLTANMLSELTFEIILINVLTIKNLAKKLILLVRIGEKANNNLLLNNMTILLFY